MLTDLKEIEKISQIIKKKLRMNQQHKRF